MDSGRFQERIGRCGDFSRGPDIEGMGVIISLRTSTKSGGGVLELKRKASRRQIFEPVKKILEKRSV